jgi:hypothetical protein
MVTVLVDNAAARRAYEPSGFVIGGTTTWSRHGRTLDEFIPERLAVPRHDSRLRESSCLAHCDGAVRAERRAGSRRHDGAAAGWRDSVVQLDQQHLARAGLA